MSLVRYSLVVALIAFVGCKHEDAPAPTPPAAPAVDKKPEPAAQPPTQPPAQNDNKQADKGADPWKSEPTKKDPLPHPMLWSASKDGKTTYFLGTIHLGIDAEARLPDIVWKDFEGAPSFAMETDLQSPEIAEMQKHMLRTKGTLHEDLGPDYWKKLEDALGAPVAKQFDGMKPMVPATFLAMKGLPQTPPMDGVLRAKAESQHKKLVFLEPPSKDEVILEKWMDVKALKEILDDLPGGEARQKEMLDAYVAGDDAKLASISNEEKDVALKHGYTAAEYDAQMKDLLYDRNASWIPELEKMHAAGGGFVAVGALHLIGPKSVLDLLGRDGFTITRVK